MMVRINPKIETISAKAINGNFPSISGDLNFEGSKLMNKAIYVIPTEKDHPDSKIIFWYLFLNKKTADNKIIAIKKSTIHKGKYCQSFQ